STSRGWPGSLSVLASGRVAEGPSDRRATPPGTCEARGQTWDEGASLPAGFCFGAAAASEGMAASAALPTRRQRRRFMNAMRLLRPAVAHAGRAVEHARLAARGRRLGVQHEIAVPLELDADAGFGMGERGFHE